MGHKIHLRTANQIRAAEPLRHTTYQEQPTCPLVGTRNQPDWHKHLRYMPRPPLKQKALPLGLKGTPVKNCLATQARNRLLGLFFFFLSWTHSV